MDTEEMSPVYKAFKNLSSKIETERNFEAFTIEVEGLCISLSEIIQKFGEELKQISNLLSACFESLSDYDKKSYKLSNKYFKPYKNRYQQIYTKSLYTYTVRKRQPRHLPYQRRNF